MDNKTALEWVEERLCYMTNYCDFVDDEENKKVYEILNYIKTVLEKEGE